MTAEPLNLSSLLPDHSDPHAAPLGDRVRGLTDPTVEWQRQVDQARADGYAAGLAEGRAAAATSQRAAAEALTQAAAAVADHATSAAAAAVAADATDLAEAAWALAKWALGRELTLDPAALVDAVADALTQVPATAEVTLYTHPDTVAAVTGFITDHSPHRIDLRADATLGLGELRVATDTGSRVEATITEIGRRALARLAGTAAATEQGPA